MRTDTSRAWGLHRGLALAYALVLGGVAALNYVPGVPRDAGGAVFGIFALDPGDDLLHLASAAWALGAALVSRRAARAFLLLFGSAYLSDGLLGLATGSGWLDGAIWRVGPQDLAPMFRVMANLPHIGLGGIAVLGGLRR